MESTYSSRDSSTMVQRINRILGKGNEGVENSPVPSTTPRLKVQVRRRMKRRVKINYSVLDERGGAEPD